MFPMPVSNAFADIVRRTAFQGFRFDGQSRRIECDFELNSLQSNRLVDLAIRSYGYRDHTEADRDIVEILTSAGDFGATSVNDIGLLNLEPGTLVDLLFGDGTRLRLIYASEAKFIVLSDASGILHRGDTLKWLSLNLAVGDRVTAVVRRNSAVYPDADTCYCSDKVSEINVVFVSPYVTLAGKSPAPCDDVVSGCARVFSNGPRLNGVFDAADLMAEASDAVFCLDLTRMEYTINPSFRPKMDNSERLLDLLGRTCDVVEGDNLRLLHAVAPGRLSLTQIRRDRCLKISEKLKVSMSPCR